MLAMMIVYMLQHNPGVAGTITLDGSLKDANDLNAIVTIYCSANESGNTFTVTGTNSSWYNYYRT